MDSDRLNKRIFLLGLSKSGPGVKNWCRRISIFYTQHTMSHLLNPNYDFNLNVILEDMQLVLSEFNEIEWYAKLSQTSAVNG